MKTPRFIPVAERGLLVEFGTEIDERVHASVLALDAALAKAPPHGLREVVPALVNLMIEFDPLVTDHRQMTNDVQKIIPKLSQAALETAQHDVPICYDTDFAPDLKTVANANGLSEDAVIAAHLQGDYRVMMYGFAPGYAYLAGVPKDIQVPRKPTPARDIAKRSVMIAGPQCLITTLNMPTGWSVIGRATVDVLQNNVSDPFLFNVGDSVRFKRVSRSDYDIAT